MQVLLNNFKKFARQRFSYEHSHFLWGALVSLVKKRRMAVSFKMKNLDFPMTPSRDYVVFFGIGRILATPSETSKVKNAPAKMLHDLDQQMEKRVDDAQSEAFKQENVLAERLHGLDQQMERKEDESLYFMDRITMDFITKLPKDKSIGEMIDLQGMKFLCRSSQIEMEDLLHGFGQGMFWPCVIDYGGRWGVHLPLAELSYNNSYHSSIQYALFEALYGRKCRSHVLWTGIGESSLIGTKFAQETTDKVVLIKEKFKAVRDRQKSYAGNRRKPLEFEVGDHVLLKVSPCKGVICFGKKGKLAPRYVEPFEILKRISSIAYRLRLPEELSSVHDTFHVSNLKKKCLADANLHVPLDEIEADKTLRFVEEPEEVILLAVELIKFRDEIPLSRGDCDTRDLSSDWYSICSHVVIMEMIDMLHVMLCQMFGKLSIEFYGKYAIYRNEKLNIEHRVKISEKARIMEHKQRVQESVLILTTYTTYHSRSIRRIQDFDELKDHCLTLKNTPYPHQRYTVYNTLVNEEEPTGFTSIRRIHQEDMAYPCPNFTKISMMRRFNTSYPEAFICRIERRLMNILEYYNHGAYAK
ncbi:putative reverse transcriptase domain-containing protein [Tanacetum coccineum]